MFGGTLPAERSCLRGNTFPAPSIYRERRELAEQAHQLANQVGLRQAARQLGVHRDALTAAFQQWDLGMPERRVGWQPSRFLTDRAEAERAFQLAEQLGSVNAAAQQLDTSWPSLRKAFARHGLGMPARNPEAVRQRTAMPATPTRTRCSWPSTRRPPARERSPAELHQWVRRDEEYATLGANVVVELYSESHARKPTTRAWAIIPPRRPQPPACRPTHQPPRPPPRRPSRSRQPAQQSPGAGDSGRLPVAFTCPTRRPAGASPLGYGHFRAPRGGGSPPGNQPMACCIGVIPTGSRPGLFLSVSAGPVSKP